MFLSSITINLLKLVLCQSPSWCFKYQLCYKLCAWLSSTKLDISSWIQIASCELVSYGMEVNQVHLHASCELTFPWPNQVQFSHVKNSRSLKPHWWLPYKAAYNSMTHKQSHWTRLSCSCELTLLPINLYSVIPFDKWSLDLPDEVKANVSVWS